MKKIQHLEKHRYTEVEREAKLRQDAVNSLETIRKEKESILINMKEAVNHTQLETVLHQAADIEVQKIKEENASLLKQLHGTMSEAGRYANYLEAPETEKKKVLIAGKTESDILKQKLLQHKLAMEEISQINEQLRLNVAKLSKLITQHEYARDKFVRENESLKFLLQ